jgi:DNA-binding MarR family transcriptional regulator
MTVQEASVLLRCVEAQSITPGQLAVRLGRDKGMITRFINRLEVSRLIVRHTNPHDRRFAVIRPTTKGKQLTRELANVFDHIRKELFAEIQEGDVRGLSRMMALLHKNAVSIGSRAALLSLQMVSRYCMLLPFVEKSLFTVSLGRTAKSSGHPRSR